MNSLFDEPDTPILDWMERFDRWSQTQPEFRIISVLMRRGFTPYFLTDQPAILNEAGHVLVGSGNHLHIPFVHNHKVVWGPDGMVAISPSGTLIPATHTI